MIGFISFIVVFNLLIFVHELGHFVAAKAVGVEISEFGFGYPPRLIKLGTWRGTAITLNALPLGGFVKMHEDDTSVPGSIANRSRSARALVFSAGALMNLLLAMLLYSVTFMLGVPMPVEQPGTGIYYVTPNSPAARAGLAPGDNVITIGDQMVRDSQHAVELVKAHLGQPVTLAVQRGDETFDVTVTPRVDPPPNEGAIGISLDLPLTRQSYPIWQAVPLGVRTTFGTVRAMCQGIRAAIRGALPFQISGPVGIYQTTKEVAQTGIDRLIEFTAFLSINLFLLNLLPLPALDGGRLIFVLLELLRGGRRIPPEKEGFVHAMGMMALIGLMIVVTVIDVQRYFG